MIAVVDVGSNSVRMIYAEREGRDFRELHRENEITRLIEGMREGVFAQAAEARTLEAMRRFAARARADGCERIFAFGTSALRDAGNAEPFLARAREFGLTIEILSGEAEARLAYLGAGASGRAGVIDAGGGSTELIAGDGGEIAAFASVQTGVVRLRDEMRGAPPEALVARAREALLPAWRAVEGAGAQRWIAVSGSAKALKTLENGVLDWQIILGQPLSRAYVRQALALLSGISPEARRRLPGMEPRRADTLRYGAAIFEAFFLLSGARELTITRGGDNMLGFLREKLTNLTDF